MLSGLPLVKSVFLGGLSQSPQLCMLLRIWQAQLSPHMQCVRIAFL